MTITVRHDGPVCIVTIDRPDVRNAVDGPTAELLADAFRKFDADDSLAVAVLHGADGTFCAGADLKGITDGRGNRVDRDVSLDGPMGPTRMLLTKPVIAAAVVPAKPFVKTGGFIALVTILSALLLAMVLRSLLCPPPIVVMAADPRQRKEAITESADLVRKEALFLEAAEAARSPEGGEPGQTSLPELSRSVWWSNLSGPANALWTPQQSPGADGTPWEGHRVMTPYHTPRTR
jgi:hypothetical protein